VKAIKISHYGDAGVLRFTDTELKPAPGEGQVLVRTHAAGMNFADIYNRRDKAGVIYRIVKKDREAAP